MKCPVTGSPMIVVERNNVEIDYSPESKGIWFDSGELELIAEALGLDAAIPDYTSFDTIAVEEEIRKSPRTGKPMDKINLGTAEKPIVIDRDRDGLGLWFDHGELAKVLELYMDKSARDGNDHVLKFLSETIHH